MFKSPGSHRGKRKPKEHFNKRNLYSKKKSKGKEVDEIEQKRKEYENVKTESVTTFNELPLSKKTLDGLEAAGYTKPTDIQRESIGLSLKGCDILGAAKTGSGKTLAFLVPVLEALWRARWTQYDGLGALIISPTRELAYQTFDVLRKIGGEHDFSAGLVIGGKHVNEESERINTTNIVICTPGRLLQHMDETYNFNADGLQILVLDEADRILDLGFKESMNAIIENLPSTRQTLLYSATQTKSVKDLARLSLKDPMFVSVHEKATFSTPQRLQQSYIVCELSEKMNVLWSFLKHHLKHKVLVFLSSCKQTRFIHEVFRRLRPGVTVLALHGAMNQLKRVAVYDQFCRKQHAVLFATDIAARGLDFPAVNWVIQMDCPENAHTYIHRAGRTARFEKDGEALLFLLPSEEQAMVKELEEKKIPISQIKVNPKKHWSIDGKLQSLLASDVQLKEFAQRAFVSYLRSVFLMKNKTVFNVGELDTDKYAASLGLAVPPRVRFLNKESQRQQQKQLAVSESESDSEPEGFILKSNAEEILMKGVEKCESRTKNKSKDKKSTKDSIDEKTKSKVGETESEKTEEDVLRFEVDESEDLFSVRRDVQVAALDEEADEEAVNKKDKQQLSKIKAAKKLLKKNVQINTKVVFDEEGEEVHDPRLHQQTADQDEACMEETGLDIEAARRRMQKEDQVDKELHRQKIRQKHKDERLKEKEKRKDEMEKKRIKFRGGEEEEEPAVLLGQEGDDSDQYDSHDDDDNNQFDSNDDDKYDSHDDDDDDVDNDEEEEDEDGDSDDAAGARFSAKRRKVAEESGSESGREEALDDNSLEADEAMAAKLLGLG